MSDLANTREQMLAYWQNIAGDTSPNTWSEEHLGMFFQGFRPHGKGVETAFIGVVGAEEILPRLKSIYAATADGWEGSESEDFYFVVRKPPALSPLRAQELVAAHLLKVLAMATEIDAAGGSASANELIEMLSPLPQIVIHSGTTPWPPDDDDPETLVYEVTTDFMRHLRWVKTPTESHAHLLREAFYTIACDYGVAYHLQWPLYSRLTSIPEPFCEYFELWRHGTGIRFDGEHLVRVYVPNLTS